MLSPADWSLQPGIHFLNHGSFGATPRFLLEEQRRWQDRLERQPVLFHRDLPELMKTARLALAGYLGCHHDDLVYITNSTYGCNVAMAALRPLLQPGDEVLTTSHEYGACIRALHNHLEGTGAAIRTVNIPMPVPPRAQILQLLRQGITNRTRAVFISHVTSPTAVALPVEELLGELRTAGILSIVDGSHVPGHLPLNLEELGADFYTGNLHKWMCTPKGSAFFYVRRAMQDAVRPLITSWGGDGSGLKESRFVDEHEYLGTRDPSAFLTVPTALQWMDRNDWHSVVTRCKDMVQATVDALEARHGFQPMHADRADECLLMGAVLLPQHVDVVQAKEDLYNKHNVEVVVHRWLNQPILRFSVFAHTTSVDLEALLNASSTLK
jgi:isopenicillin-N epimerase